MHLFLCFEKHWNSFPSVAWPDWNLLLPPATPPCGDFRHVIAPDFFLKPCICFCVWEGVGVQCALAHARSQFFSNRFHKPNSGRQLWQQVPLPTEPFAVHTWLSASCLYLKLSLPILPRPHSNLWAQWSSCFHLPSGWVLGHPPSHLATPFIVYRLFWSHHWKFWEKGKDPEII